jgi:hypothetical protein
LGNIDYATTREEAAFSSPVPVPGASPATGLRLECRDALDNLSGELDRRLAEYRADPRTGRHGKK